LLSDPRALGLSMAFGPAVCFTLRST
jgi:hypothetical protein